MDLEFVQKRYQHEFERKDKIRDSIATPISAMIVIGGLIVAMAQNFTYGKEPWTVVFLVGVIVSGSLLAVCLYNFFNAFQSQRYKEIGPLAGFQETYTKLLDYDRQRIACYRQTGNTSAASLIEANPTDVPKKFAELVTAQMIAFTDLNQQSNLAKTKYLERGTDWLWLLILSTIATAVPYVVNQANTSPKPQVVHIDNLPTGKDVGHAR